MADIRKFIVTFAEIKTVASKPMKDGSGSMARITLEAEINDDIQQMQTDLSGAWEVSFERQQAKLGDSPATT